MHKNKEAHIPIVANVKDVLRDLNRELTDDDLLDLTEWKAQIAEWKSRHPLHYKEAGDHILQQYAIEELWRRRKTATRTSPSAWASTRCGPPSSTSFPDPGTG